MLAALEDRRRFWRYVIAIQGAVTPLIMPRVLVFGATAALVTALRRFLAGYTLEVGPVELVGGALVVLEVVRTNAGYERWWEGRKLWGGIVNQSRNLAISALAYAPRADPAWRERFAQWVAAFPHAARGSLRGERELPELKRLRGDDAQGEQVSRSVHLPSAIARQLATLLHSAVEQGLMTPFAFLQCDRQRALLIDHIGACERILKTPLPLVYVIILRRFVALYLFVLPLALIDRVGWAAPLLTMLAAYPLLGLDYIAVELEKPFSKHSLNHLPLDEICETIERNVLGLIHP
jgi:putative membrane protein